MDADQKMCLYSNKERHKCGKLLFEHQNERYKLTYFNKMLVSYSDGKTRLNRFACI